MAGLWRDIQVAIVKSLIIDYMGLFMEQKRYSDSWLIILHSGIPIKLTFPAF